MNWREINHKLQELADRVGVHWLVVLLGVATLVVGTLFGLVKFGFWLWAMSHTEPPVYVFKYRIENLNNRWREENPNYKTIRIR